MIDGYAVLAWTNVSDKLVEGVSFVLCMGGEAEAAMRQQHCSSAVIIRRVTDSGQSAQSAAGNNPLYPLDGILLLS